MVLSDVLEMSTKRTLLIMLAIICLIIAFFAVLSFNNITQGTENVQTAPLPQNPDGILFVIPESPAGTFGMIGAFAAAFVIFAVIMKKKSKI